MFLFKYFLLFLLLLQSSLGFARSECVSEIIVIVNKGRITGEQKRIIRQQKESIEAIADHVDTHTTYLKSPRDMRLIYNRENVSPHYLIHTDIMSTGTRFYSPKPGVNQAVYQDIVDQGLDPLALVYLSKHPIHSNTITAHELGHGILETSLAQFYPTLREVLDVFKNVSRPLNDDIRNLAMKRMELQKELDDHIVALARERQIESVPGFYLELRSDPSVVSRMAEIEELRLQIIAKNLEINDRIGPVLANNISWQIQRTPIYRGLHELFADVIAVTAGGKYRPTAVRDSLRFITDIKKGGRRLARIENRNFANSDNSISKWMGTEIEDVHGFLSPVRYHLHENYLRRPVNQTPENLGKVYDALILTITNYLNFVVAKNKEFNEMTLQQINQKFIDDFDYHARELGLNL